MILIYGNKHLRSDLEKLLTLIQAIISRLDAQEDYQLPSEVILKANEIREAFNFLSEAIPDQEEDFSLDEAINFLASSYDQYIPDLLSSGAGRSIYAHARPFSLLSRQEQRYRLLEMTINPSTMKTYRSRYDCFLFLGVESDEGRPRRYKFLPERVRRSIIEDLIFSGRILTKQEKRDYIQTLLTEDGLL